MDKIKEPQQQRSIEKKNKIIKAGMELISEQGYHHTNTAQIAKAAGVSTGIIYRYFPDKKAILMDGLEYYFSKDFERMLKQFDSLTLPMDLTALLDNIIEIFVSSHTMSKNAHEEIEALSHSDKDISDYVHMWKREKNTQLLLYLPKLGIKTDHPMEKLHLIMELVEIYCHEFVYRRVKDLDYTVVKQLLIRTILSIISS